jgi:hypothetical protein
MPYFSVISGSQRYKIRYRFSPSPAEHLPFTSTIATPTNSRMRRAARVSSHGYATPTIAVTLVTATTQQWPPICEATCTVRAPTSVTITAKEAYDVKRAFNVGWLGSRGQKGKVLILGTATEQFPCRHWIRIPRLIKILVAPNVFQFLPVRLTLLPCEP